MSDLIRREDVMALWDKYHYEIATKAVEFDKDLREIPSAEPKHGKWIPDKTGNSYWICTKCGFPSEASGAFALYHYCPNCGADMRMDG